MKQVMICAAESSGDKIGAGVVSAMRDLGLGGRYFGMTGPAMGNAGVESLGESPDAGVIGIWEAARHGLTFLRLRRRLLKALNTQRPDMLITIDSPDLFLSIGRRAKKLGIPVTHIVSPQVWAWRSRRVRTIGRSVDQILCLFRHEPDCYLDEDVEAYCVGHPSIVAANIIPPRSPRTASSGLRVGLAPGSRVQEVKRIWPAMLEVVRGLKKQVTVESCVVAAAPGMPVSHYQNDLNISLEYEGVRHMAKNADVVLVTSGTATIEVAMTATPMVVVYALHPVSHLLGRLLVKSPHGISLPNILLEDKVVPEFVQTLNAQEIAVALLEIASTSGVEQSRVLFEVCSEHAKKNPYGEMANRILALWIKGGAPPTPGEHQRLLEKPHPPFEGRAITEEFP